MYFIEISMINDEKNLVRHFWGLCNQFYLFPEFRQRFLKLNYYQTLCGRVNMWKYLWKWFTVQIWAVSVRGLVAIRLLLCSVEGHNAVRGRVFKVVWLPTTYILSVTSFWAVGRFCFSGHKQYMLKARILKPFDSVNDEHVIHHK